MERSHIHSIFYHLFGFLLLWQAAFNISNAAVAIFIKFLKYFVLVLGKAYGCDTISNASSHLPTT